MAKYAVIGLGKFGVTVATTLFKHGAEVIAIDKEENIVEEVQGNVTAAVKLDATNEESLKRIGVHEMDGVILAIGNNIEVSVLTSVILKKLGASPIYAKADSSLHRRILEMLGIHHIVFPEEQIGIQIAKSLISSNVLDYVNLSSNHTLVELAPPASYIGKTLLDLALPTKMGVNIIAIKSNKLKVTEDGENIVERAVNDMPGANDVVENGDTLILLGPENRINEIIAETSKKNN